MVAASRRSLSVTTCDARRNPRRASERSGGVERTVVGQRCEESAGSRGRRGMSRVGANFAARSVHRQLPAVILEGPRYGVTRDEPLGGFRARRVGRSGTGKNRDQAGARTSSTDDRDSESVSGSGDSGRRSVGSAVRRRGTRLQSCCSRDRVRAVSVTQTEAARQGGDSARNLGPRSIRRVVRQDRQ